MHDQYKWWLMFRSNYHLYYSTPTKLLVVCVEGRFRMGGFAIEVAGPGLRHHPENSTDTHSFFAQHRGTRPARPKARVSPVSIKSCGVRRFQAGAATSLS